MSSIRLVYAILSVWLHITAQSTILQYIPCSSQDRTDQVIVNKSHLSRARTRKWLRFGYCSWFSPLHLPSLFSLLLCSRTHCKGAFVKHSPTALYLNIKHSLDVLSQYTRFQIIMRTSQAIFAIGALFTSAVAGEVEVRDGCVASYTVVESVNRDILHHEH